MPKKKSLADELADLFNPAPTKGETAVTGPTLMQKLLGATPPLRQLPRRRQPPPPPPLPALSRGACPHQPLVPCASPQFPPSEFDPEADVFGAGPALEDSDEELAADAARK